MIIWLVENWTIGQMIFLKLYFYLLLIFYYSLSFYLTIFPSLSLSLSIFLSLSLSLNLQLIFIFLNKFEFNEVLQNCTKQVADISKRGAPQHLTILYLQDVFNQKQESCWISKRNTYDFIKQIFAIELPKNTLITKKFL